MFKKKTRLKPDISLKIDGEIIAEDTSSIFGLYLLMLNWIGNTMCHVYAEKLLVAQAL